MRIRIPQDLLDEGLRAVSRAVSTKNTIPVLSGIHLRADGHQLLLRASDLELTVHRVLPADVLSDGEIVLAARYLTELIRRLPPGVVELQVEPGSTLARISGPDCEYLVHGFPGEQFPAEPALPDGGAVEIRAGDLRRLLREVIFAISRDESRPHLTGPAFAVAESTACAMATDGAILARSECAAVNPPNLAFQAILPGRVAQELVRLLGETAAETCSVMPLRNQLRFQLGDVTLITQLIDGIYPDLLRLLPREFPSCVTADRTRLMETCERAALVARQGAVQLEGRRDGLHILAVTPEVGKVWERVPAELAGEPFAVPLNVEYLLAGLRAGSSTAFQLEFAGGRSAVRFRPPGAEASFFAVMPMLNF